MTPFVPYFSAADGSGYKYPLAARPAPRGGELAIEVEVGDGDADFRWALDLECSVDGGKTWAAEQGLFGKSAASDSGRFTVPAAGLLRCVLKVEAKDGVSARVFGSVTVRDWT